MKLLNKDRYIVNPISRLDELTNIIVENKLHYHYPTDIKRYTTYNKLNYSYPEIEVALSKLARH